ncbi:MAG TPA: CbiX/SirB N-terminal domain-containing protein [Burkholderiales bacterium]|jgi:sirohydrochlorin cobaltochelatase|nr:CbiX/SirB N-terminal domain-containing protein [Burkholderiales bacterium]
MKRTPRDAIVLFAHGARDPGWAEPFRRIQARLRAACPEAAVELAFLESLQPGLADAAARLADAGVSHMTVVPLFLAQGGHLKEDLPRLVARIRQTHPAVRIRVTAAIGDSEALTDAIADWALAQHREAPGS